MTTTHPANDDVDDAYLTVAAWEDPVLDETGHDPRSVYVEVVWAGILGPTATLLYRRLGTLVTARPDGDDVDLVDLAVSLGLGEGIGRHSKLHRAINRLGRFGFVHYDGARLLVRRRAGNVPELLARRLSYSSRLEHEALITAVRRCC